MSPSKLGIFANLALVASAVLIPPTITADDVGDDNAMEGLVVDPFKRSAIIECPGCALATQEDHWLSWQQDAGSAFQLDFEVGSGENTVGIDGYQLFPPVFNTAQQTFYVSQISPDVREPLRLQVTGYTFHYNGAETIDEDGMELLPMTLQIAAVEGVPVNPPELRINVLKDASGHLMIASFETEQPQEKNEIAKEGDCNEWPLLCKWKSIVADRIEKMKKMGKGCHKRPHGHHNPMEEETIAGKPPHRFHPGRPHPHHRPHHHKGHGHHPHHPHSRVHMFARRAFFTILIPIIIGIFAGTVTYLLGMVLGTLIAIVIARMRGQSYQRIALEDDVEEAEVEAEIHSEKAEYAELPAYDAPPVYEDTPNKEADESK
ncbi:hypothetical protein FB567DRAFT_273303 [Paraphoma chrysanthemicola]|uniref:DUF7728 domain-containing protein n=1 Tax=Paraphoma chrysanthemicola TaxID=798071 RepID=A0A8K0W1A0_9PLEO|nr:hypothetical protein FB567DRAFT_273303 [Paraphoma chrysanthemicola]